MTENTAMNLLGLKLSTEGKNRKPKQVTDYSEDELLNAFRETCNMIGKQFLLEGFQLTSSQFSMLGDLTTP